jgi:hypothetical protein
MNTVLNENEVLIINSIINNIFNSDIILENRNNTFINKLLFVDNFFEETCGCFEDEDDQYQHTYENMVKNTEYYITELEIKNNIIESFIHNNIYKKYMDNNNFELEILINERMLKDSNILITFSNIGFNNDKTEALIFMSIKIPMNFPIISYGKYIYLIKYNETWNIKNEKYSWLGP